MQQRWYQKTSVQAAIISGVFVVIAALVASYQRYMTEQPLPAPAPRTQFNSKLVEQSNNTKYSAQGLDERVRLRTGLRLITAAESGLHPDKVPAGTYAFAHPSVLRYGESEMLRTPEYGRLSFEVQKPRDGAFYVVAFVNADEQRKLAVQAKISGPATLYSDSWEEARHAALIDPTFCNGENRDVTLDDGSRINAVDCEPVADKPVGKRAP